MANPNKTVAEYRRRNPWPREEDTQPVSPFVEWLAQQAQAGVIFNTLPEAEAAYATATQPSPWADDLAFNVNPPCWQLRADTLTGIQQWAGWPDSSTAERRS